MTTGIETWGGATCRSAPIPGRWYRRLVRPRARSVGRQRIDDAVAPARTRPARRAVRRTPRDPGRRHHRGGRRPVRAPTC